MSRPVVTISTEPLVVTVGDVDVTAEVERIAVYIEPSTGRHKVSLTFPLGPSSLSSNNTGVCAVTASALRQLGWEMREDG